MTLVSLKRPSKCWMGRIYDKIKTVDIEEIVYIEVSPSVFYQLRYELDPPRCHFQKKIIISHFMGFLLKSAKRQDITGIWDCS